ncbi:sortase [Bifidobacterium simiarum]|uniref:sortase n=1 Tax=Bifidobacterium simiarum TaxID=2045441 RepID=UPI001BDD8BCF|nr:sortase [Bifidobacterium simiarum]MBT1166541.1 class C sortase [Bifidobacterium simiarum]
MADRAGRADLPDRVHRADSAGRSAHAVRPASASWRFIVYGDSAATSPRTVRGRLTLIGIVMIVVGALILSLPLTIGLADMPRSVGRSAGSSVGGDGGGVGDGVGGREATLRRASDYDRRLLTHGTLAVGEAADPFRRGSGIPAHEQDADYQAQLGGGVLMAFIRIPRIGVNLPVGHGTSDSLLETQAGHMYGTTLPVGDPGNAVIAAHRGLGARLLFYRLGELSAGDMVYTEAAGSTVAWRVDSLIRVDPGSDGERRAIAQGGGGTVLTLYTCDPPGLNTRRLIVRAHRVPYVDERSVPNQRDPWAPWICAGATGVVAVTIALIATPRRQVMRHAAR